MESHTEVKLKLDRAIELTVELFNTLVSIDSGNKHPMDDSETCADIHNIQNRIISIAYTNDIKLEAKLR